MPLPALWKLIKGSVARWISRLRENPHGLRHPFLWIWTLIKDSRTSWISWLLTLIVIVIAARNCSINISTYNNQNHPNVIVNEFQKQMIGNDYFYNWLVVNVGNEDAMKIHLKFFGIDSNQTRETQLKPEDPFVDVWPRLAPQERDWVKLKIDAAKFPYVLICMSYSSERGKFSDGKFYGPLDTTIISLGPPPPPPRAVNDTLKANFSCPKD